MNDDQQAQLAYDTQMAKEGFIKVRQSIGKGRYAVRYLPKETKLRIDEQLCEMPSEPEPKEFYR